AGATGFEPAAADDRAPASRPEPEPQLRLEGHAERTALRSETMAGRRHTEITGAGRARPRRPPRWRTRRHAGPQPVPRAVAAVARAPQRRRQDADTAATRRELAADPGPARRQRHAAAGRETAGRPAGDPVERPAIAC